MIFIILIPRKKLEFLFRGRPRVRNGRDFLIVLPFRLIIIFLIFIKIIVSLVILRLKLVMNDRFVTILRRLMFLVRRVKKKIERWVPGKLNLFIVISLWVLIKLMQRGLFGKRLKILLLLIKIVNRWKFLITLLVLLVNRLLLNFKNKFLIFNRRSIQNSRNIFLLVVLIVMIINVLRW